MAFCQTAGAADGTLRLATTTSTENSGLLGHLLPEFRRQTGIVVHVIAVGSGKALKLAEDGEVDLVLAHSPEDELHFMARGFGSNRRAVMFNDFVLVGPPSDPAGVTAETRAAKGFLRIAARQAVFLSRGDESGTHKKELSIWREAGVAPAGLWYLETGQGMEAVLMMAHERSAYTLSDRGTFLACGQKTSLAILLADDKTLTNRYSVMAVNPLRHPHVNRAGAETFIRWITSTAGQDQIRSFVKNGQPLFFPCVAEPPP